MTFLYGRYLNYVDIDSILIFANIVLFPFSAFVGRVANLISRSNVKLHIFVLEFLHFKSFRPSGQIWYEGQISLREALQWFLLSSSSWYQSIYMVLSVQMYLPHLSRSIMAGILRLVKNVANYKVAASQLLSCQSKPSTLTIYPAIDCKTWRYLSQLMGFHSKRKLRVVLKAFCSFTSSQFYSKPKHTASALKFIFLYIFLTWNIWVWAHEKWGRRVGWCPSWDPSSPSKETLPEENPASPSSSSSVKASSPENFSWPPLERGKVNIFWRWSKNRGRGCGEGIWS